VLRGSVVFEYGKESFNLEEGDSLYFDADTPHRLHNTCDTKAEVLCVFLDK
jgi:mannose-6-phosphate isomerase-like protein (cupin superfamily)